MVRAVLRIVLDRLTNAISNLVSVLNNPAKNSASTRLNIGEACKSNLSGGATVAQWIRLRLPSCHPGFKSQAQHLTFINLNCDMLNRRK